MRGLRSKSQEFYASLCPAEYDIVALTETWLADAISSGEYFPEGYSVLRRDRDYHLTHCERGGGAYFWPCVHNSSL